jgi:AP-3 complex subunit mu
LIAYLHNLPGRYKKWNKDAVLSFIPPDGHFKLLEYQVAKPTSGVTRPIGIPLSVKPAIKVEKNGGELVSFASVFVVHPLNRSCWGVQSGKFVITVSSRINARPVESIVLSWYLGDGTTAVSATATGEKRGPMNGGAGGRTDDPAGAVGGGSWEWDPNTKVRPW